MHFISVDKTNSENYCNTAYARARRYERLAAQYDAAKNYYKAFDIGVEAVQAYMQIGNVELMSCIAEHVAYIYNRCKQLAQFMGLDYKAYRIKQQDGVVESSAYVCENEPENRSRRSDLTDGLTFDSYRF